MTNWNRKINGLGPILDNFDDYGENFTEVRDQTVAFFKADKAYGQADHQKFTDAVEMLEYSEDRAEFDEWLGEIYDWADDELIWIDPYKEAGAR